jgi:hypothetical protein
MTSGIRKGYNFHIVTLHSSSARSKIGTGLLAGMLATCIQIWDGRRARGFPLREPLPASFQIDSKGRG